MGHRRAAALVLVAIAATAACGKSTPPAATVDGTRISQQEMVDELEAIRANEAYVQVVEEGGGSILGEGDDAYDSAFVAEQLATRIQYAIVGNEVERRNLEADAACRDAARSSVEQQFTSQAGEEYLDGFPDSYVDYLVERDADVLLLQGDLIGQRCVSDDAIAEYYEEHRDELEQACSSHILVATREEADEVVALLRGGADFAALASERSTDPGSASSGGSLGCRAAGEFVPEFEAAVASQPVGEIGEPVETDFGFHVIRVDSRGVPSLEEARDQIAQQIGQEVQTAFQEWFTNALAEADVTVDPRYGSWDPTTARIDRPVDVEVDGGEGGSSSTSTPAAG